MKRFIYSFVTIIFINMFALLINWLTSATYQEALLYILVGVVASYISDINENTKDISNLKLVSGFLITRQNERDENE